MSFSRWPVLSGGITGKTVLHPESPEYNRGALPTHITIQGQQFTRWLAVASQKDLRKRKSNIWLAGEQLVSEKDGQSHYYWYHCEREKKKQTLFVVNGNQGPLNHLLRDYGIEKQDNRAPQPQASTGSDVVISMVSLVTNKSLQQFKSLLV